MPLRDERDEVVSGEVPTRYVARVGDGDGKDEPTAAEPSRPAGARPRRPRGWRWAVGSLRRRFYLLLVLLGVLSIAPWVTSGLAARYLGGRAHQVERTGSLRYRLLELGSVSNGATPEELLQREQVVDAQREALRALIDGDPVAQIPPCESEAICARLRAHLKRLDEEFAAPPSGVGPTSQGAERRRLALELGELNDTVELIAAAAEARVDAVQRANLVSAVSIIALVVLVGFGVWEVFARISRVRQATEAPAAEARLTELSAGTDEVAGLARSLAGGLGALRERHEADQRAALALATQQRAVHALAVDLNRWLEGEKTLDAALAGVAACVGCDAAWAELDSERSEKIVLGSVGVDEETRASVATELALVGDSLPSGPPGHLAERGEESVACRRMDTGEFHTLVATPLGSGERRLGLLCLASSRADYSLTREHAALVHMVAHHVSTALVARHLLDERERTEELATTLATAPELDAAGAPFSALLQRTVRYDVALLHVFGRRGVPQHAWRLAALGPRRVEVAWSGELPRDITTRRAEPLDALPVGRRGAATEVLVAPLRAGDEDVGVLLLGRRGAAFTAADVAAARTVTPVLASAIARMQLQATLRLTDQASAFDGFSRMLAHEVRNPLNSMALHAELILRRLTRDGSADGRIRDSVGVLRDEIARLDEVVKNYLAMTRSGAALPLQPLDLREVVTSVASVHEPALAEQGIALLLDLGEEPAMVSAERARLQQVLHNLVRNAMDAMSAPGEHRLELTLRGTEKWWELRVADTGPGIAEPERVFSPSYSTKPTGGGMGLPLSLQIARLHGGFLVARNREGGGAELVLTLPRQSAEAGVSAG